MKRLTHSKGIYWAISASLFLALVGIPMAPSSAVTPGTAGCELTGVNGPTSAGSVSNPYKVSTAEELAEVTDCDSFTSRHFQMTNDIDLTGVAWKPIGAGATPNDNPASTFYGQFDGQGFKISNLVTSDSYSGGLFAAMAGASANDRSSVKDLTIQGRVYSGAFGIKVQSTSFSNVVLNVDVRRNPAASSRTKLGAFAPEGFQVNASSISIAAAGEYGLMGLTGDSSTTAVAGMFATVGDWNNDPTPNVFSDVSIQTYVGGTKPSVNLGGMFETANDNTEIRDSKIHVTLDSFQAGTTYQLPRIGGILGGNSSTDNLTISATSVHALIVLPYSSYSPYIDFYAGGVMGIGAAKVVSVSAITHFHIPPNVGYGNNSNIGGFFGVSQGSSSIDQSYASLSVTRDANNTSNINLGNLVGSVGNGANIVGTGNIYNESSSELVDVVTGDSTGAASYALAGTGFGFDQLQPATFISAGWDMAAASNTFEPQKAWNICDHPYPTSVGVQGCDAKVIGGKVSRNGQGFELFFSSPLDGAQTPLATALSIQVNGNQNALEQIQVSSFGISNSRAVSFSNQAEFDSGVVVVGSYTAPQSGQVFVSETGRQVANLPATRFANSSFLVPPTAAISLVSSSVTSASLQVLCSADCGSGTNFTYSIEVEKTGTGVVVVTSNDSGSISGLQPSTSYTAKATVTFNGRTSTEVSVAFNTQRPEATISAVTLNGQEVTGLISCSNCGANPSTLSFMATPTSGGPSITSSSEVLSGLATATSYSISVRVTFMGAESLEVTWSSTILTTADPMPVITSINPASVLTSGGTEVTVVGTNFTGASVSVDGVAVSPVTIVSGTELKFTSPVGSAGNSNVRVTNTGGFDEVTLAYNAPPAATTPGSAPPVVINTPTITEFSTREISASGGEVTATGRRLADISVLTLGGIAVTIVSNTDTSVTFTTGAMPVGTWDLRLVGSNGTLTFQQAITVTEQAIVSSESTGELLGWTWTLKFTGNSRSFSEAQQNHLQSRLSRFEDAEAIICWGYTTAASPNAWAIAHATQRAQAACDFALANQSNVKTIVRLRYGVSKDYAMRSALQFWK